jgi:hypothetical protein
MTATSLEEMAAHLASGDVGPWRAVEESKDEFEGALEDLSTLSLAAFYGLIQSQAYTDMSNRVSKAALASRREAAMVRRDMERILSSVATEFLRKKRESRKCCG